MKHSTNFNLSLLLSATFLLISAELSATPLTDCKVLGKDATGCDKCFDMGSVYQGNAINKLDLTLNNISNDTAEVMFLDNWGSFQYSVLQPNSKFSHTIGNYLEFPKNIGWDNKDGRSYHAFLPNTTEKYLSFAAGHGIVFTESASSMSTFKPALRIDVTENLQSFNTKADILSGRIKTTRYCAFAYPRWCGDGVVDKQEGEVCDLGISNGQIGASCSSSCKVALIPK